MGRPIIPRFLVVLGAGCWGLGGAGRWWVTGGKVVLGGSYGEHVVDWTSCLMAST